MTGLLRRWWPRKPVAPPASATWQEVERGFRRLRAWGFGREYGDAGYRKRLNRLCRFLLDLDPRSQERAGRRPKPTDFEKLEIALENGSPGRAPLMELLKPLEELQRRTSRQGAGEKEELELYLARLEAGLVAIRKQDQESPEDHAARSRRLEKILNKLGLPPAGAPRQQDFLPGLINGLRKRLVVLRATSSGVQARVEEEMDRLREILEDCIADWEWAYLQALVRLARSGIQDDLAAGADRLTPAQAQDHLRQAIRRLEEGEYLQPQTQGLYGLLAESYLGCARSQQVDPAQRVKLLQQGLAYGKRCAEIEPERVRDRLALLRILSALQDYEEMKAQAEIALNLDSGPETLKAIGASFWERAAPLRRGARRKILREAADFFADMLRHVESASFDEGHPLEQAEAHGWAHFWLGRFLCESGRCDAGIPHLRVACELGFKPLESKVEMAWAYFLGRDWKRADHAFLAAVEEAQRLRAAGVRDRPWGEERAVEELELDAYLGWALLTAERAPELVAGRLQHARERLASISRLPKADLEAALREAHGRALLNLGDFKAGIAILEEAVQLSVRSGAYCCLGLARLEQAQSSGQGLPEALRRARRDYRLALEADGRGRYRREIWRLRGELRRLDKANEAKTTPAKPQAAEPAAKPTPPEAGNGTPLAKPPGRRHRAWSPKDLSPPAQISDNKLSDRGPAPFHRPQRGG